MNSVSFNLGNFKDHGELILDVEINKQLISPGFSQSVFSRETGEIKIPTNLQVLFLFHNLNMMKFIVSLKILTI